MDLSSLPKPPSRIKLLFEARALLELYTFLPSLPILKELPKGDGHPVVVYPGFMTGNITTQPMRYFLRKQGYETFGWAQGINDGYIEDMEVVMADRIKRLSDQYGKKVSLIGWSLGGVYAREVAREVPDHVRQVITLGSPLFRPRNASNIGWLYDLLNGHRMSHNEESMFKRMEAAPPVPTTAIYSRSDGVVSWQCSKEQEEGPFTQNIEVRGSHCGLGHNPLALYIIGDRLAQPEGQWSHFSRDGLRGLFYKETVKQEQPVYSNKWNQTISDLDKILASFQQQQAL